MDASVLRLPSSPQRSRRASTSSRTSRYVGEVGEGIFRTHVMRMVSFFIQSHVSTHVSILQDSVHNGKLMDFDEERAASQMSASMESITGANTARTAPAAVGGDSSNGSRARTPLKGYSASSVHDPPRPLGKDAPEPLKYHVLAIMDGHNGHEAPEYLMHTLRRLIHSRLPAVHTIPIKVSVRMSKSNRCSS